MGGSHPDAAFASARAPERYADGSGSDGWGGSEERLSGSCGSRPRRPSDNKRKQFNRLRVVAGCLTRAGLCSGERVFHVEPNGPRDLFSTAKSGPWLNLLLYFTLKTPRPGDRSPTGRRFLLERTRPMFHVEPFDVNGPWSPSVAAVPSSLRWFCFT